MSKSRIKRVQNIFAQLQVLRASVDDLERIEGKTVKVLKGHQTVNDNEAVQLSFATLIQHITQMEETLATIAEATGDIRKF